MVVVVDVDVDVVVESFRPSPMFFNPLWTIFSVSVRELRSRVRGPDVAREEVNKDDTEVLAEIILERIYDCAPAPLCAPLNFTFRGQQKRKWAKKKKNVRFF